MKRPSRRVVAALQLACVAIYVVVACLVSRAREQAFDRVVVGQSEAQVRALFERSEPTRTGPGGDAARLAAPACQACDHRLWFENRMTLDIEAWVVDFDPQGRVLAKARWHRWG